MSYFSVNDLSTSRLGVYGAKYCMLGAGTPCSKPPAEGAGRAQWRAALSGLPLLCPGAGPRQLTACSTATACAGGAGTKMQKWSLPSYASQAQWGGNQGKTKVNQARLQW